MADWIDKHLWVVPLILFVSSEVALGVTEIITGRPFLLAAAGGEQRNNIYSSLTGSSSGLLGFALAAVAILAAFGRRQVENDADRQREDELAKARRKVCELLLSTSFFLMVILVVATVAMGVDSKESGNFAITSVIFSSSVSGVVGLLIGGTALTLSLIERSE